MTKTLKPVLALSVAALTLLAGCAKGEANTAWSAAKKDVKGSLSVKSWDSCQFIHTDSKKQANYAKSQNSDLSDDDYNTIKDAGNSVSLFYTFTIKDGTTYFGSATYTVKDKKLSSNTTAEYGTGVAALAYNTALTIWQEAYKNVITDYQTAGVLVK